MTVDIPDPTKLLECFEDAFVQRSLLEPRANDRNLTAAGWSLRYAVDASIFGLFLDPASYATGRNRHSLGVGEVFRADMPERKTKIAGALADFIWNVLQPKISFLAIPPINGEIYNQILFRTQHHAKSTDNEPSELRKISERLESEGHVLTKEDLNDLRDAYMLDSAPPAILDRIQMIISTNRIQSADSPSLPHHDFDAVFRDALRQATSIQDMFLFARLSGAWQDRLNKLGRVKSDPAARDVEVMTRLEICNERLSQAGDRRRRLIYITTDQSLLEAGSTYIPGHDNDGASFSQLYLRHPRSFLNEPEVLSPAGNAGESAVTLDGWLQVLLGRFDDLGKSKISPSAKVTFPKIVIDDIKELHQGDRYAADKILSQWADYEAKANLDLPKKYLDRFIKRLKSNTQTFNSQLTSLREEIRESKSRAWESFFFVSTSARFVLQILTADGVPDRDKPQLCFQNRENLHAFLSQANIWLRDRSSFDLTDYQEHIAAIYREDDTSYDNYIAHGYVMALQLQWRTAAILCLRAIECIENPQSTFNPGPTASNGREAYYFRAFCGRQAATSLKDLDGLEALVAKAESITEAEASFVRKQKLTHDPVVERFEAEHNAIKFTRQLFKWYDAPSNEKHFHLDEIGDFIPIFQAFAGKVESRLDHLIAEDAGRRPTPHYATPVPIRREILLTLWVRTMRNILAIGLQNPIHRDAARSAWERLYGLEQERPEFISHSSYLSKFMFYAGQVIFDGNRTLEREARRILRRDYRIDMIKRRKIYPYDIDRITNLFPELGLSD